MAGHRRLSNTLYRKYRRKGVEATPIEALLELDEDLYLGKFGEKGPPVKTYARFWGWTPNRARRLILEWKQHRNDLYNAETADPLRTPAEPEANPQADPVAAPGVDPQTGEVSEGYVEAADPPSNPQSDPVPDTSRTPGGPFADPILEPNRTGGGVGPPPRPAALRVGVAESRESEARRQVDRALADAGPTTPERQESRRFRLTCFARMILACGQAPGHTRILDLARRTDGVPNSLLQAAIDEARSTRERSGNDFPPTAEEINAAGRALAARARKAARGA